MTRTSSGDSNRFKITPITLLLMEIVTKDSGAVLIGSTRL